HRRGFYVSLQFVSQQVGVLASSLVGLALSLSISQQALDSWGWRAAFLFGLIIVPFGLILRRGLVESFHAPPPAAAAPKPAPAQSVSSGGFRLLAVLGLLMLAGGTTVNYIGNYMT